ncbi:MAG TPA: MobF family relaxase [Acidimicrobiales bacterium]|nr:MobF family relaxase [Acidimicrobiales bacterium]
MMRVTTLKAGVDGPGLMIEYYAGLARDHQRADGPRRGPIDYYLDPHEPPGRWWGTGRAALGVDGEVRPEELEALLTARHPRTGAKLGRGFGRRSARGFDATFSAPKSLSVLWALSDDPWVQAEVLAAHDAAVIAALEFLEARGAVTRRGTDGVDQVDTGGITVALFRQHTSRSMDPQIHTHALISAKVQDATGTWLALDARFLKYQQRSISYLYAAALRTELTARLGLSWAPVVEGHAEAVEVPEGLLEAFSKRAGQVEEALALRIARWVESHDGAEPDTRTIARLERQAVLVSRPHKETPVQAEALRATWLREATAAGYPSLSPSLGQRRLPGSGAWDAEAVITGAIEAVTASSATWLEADLAREIAALLPPDAAGSAAGLVGLVDDLADRTAERCVELHPPAIAGATRRVDGRPLSEHVTDRRLTTRAVLGQEAGLVAWAAAAVGAPIGQGYPATAAADAVAGEADLVLIVGPAGSGKTTTLAGAVDSLRRQGRGVIGLAPSGKAADVLATETGAPANTLAKLLYEHHRAGGPSPEWAAPAGTTVILDEASMAATDDLDALVGLVRANQWRLVCVGDPAQLPAVGRGGVFEYWCENLPAHHLSEVRRFSEDWQATASLALRRGEPGAAAAYAAHGRLRSAHPATLATGVAGQHERLSAGGATVAITTASAGVARAINTEIQRRRNPGLAGPSVGVADGSRVFVGDVIATRRNSTALAASDGSPVRNRQTWTVSAVGADGSLTVTDPTRGSVRLPGQYVVRHVELGWAVTGYGSQGVTVDHGICVVEPSSTRAGIYVGMTRGRDRNLAWVVDRTGLLDAEEAFADAIAKPVRALSAHGVRDHLYRAQGQPVEVEAAQRMIERLARPAPKPPTRGLVR